MKQMGGTVSKTDYQAFIRVSSNNGIINVSATGWNGIDVRLNDAQNNIFIVRPPWFDNIQLEVTGDNNPSNGFHWLTYGSFNSPFGEKYLTVRYALSAILDGAYGFKYVFENMVNKVVNITLTVSVITPSLSKRIATPFDFHYLKASNATVSLGSRINSDGKVTHANKITVPTDVDLENVVADSVTSLTNNFGQYNVIINMNNVDDIVNITYDNSQCPYIESMIIENNKLLITLTTLPPMLGFMQNITSSSVSIPAYLRFEVVVIDNSLTITPAVFDRTFGIDEVIPDDNTCQLSLVGLIISEDFP